MQKQTKPSRETNKQKISYSFTHLPAPEQAKENKYLFPPKQTFIPSQTNKRKNKAKNKQEKNNHPSPHKNTKQRKKKQAKQTSKKQVNKTKQKNN